MVPKKIREYGDQYKTASQAYGIDLHSLQEQGFTLSEAKRI